MDKLEKSMQKIKTIKEIAEEVEKLKKEGKKIVLCHGEFDLFHPGHLRYLKGAKKEGDILVVTITPDRYINKGPGRPVFNEQLRAESIAALEIVDFVGINEWKTAVETLKLIKPDVYCKGAEYKDRSKDVTGRISLEEKVITELGGRLHLVEDITFSSSQLINQYFDIYPSETLQFIKEFKKDHSYEDIIKRMDQIKDLKFLIIGDTIIDEYRYCKPLGKSQKSSNIVVKWLSSEKFAGGVLATANHLAQFSENVTLLTCIGEIKDHRDFIEEHLNPIIKKIFYTKPKAVTTIKRRYVEAGFIEKLFEICFIDDYYLPENISEEICEYLEKHIKDFDVVVVNDFGHGFIDKRMIELLSKAKVYLAVNAQTNSANYGFNLITKYKNVDYACIDEPELKLACQDHLGETKDLMKKCYEILNSRTITVTRGHKGSTVYNSKYGYADVPVLSTKVVDTIGAGDAFFAITSALDLLKFTPVEIGFIGNCVGALAVQIVGNREPIEKQRLYKFITAILK